MSRSDTVTGWMRVRSKSIQSYRSALRKGVVDLLKIAKHGKGENVYLVRFHYLPPRRKAEVR